MSAQATSAARHRSCCHKLLLQLACAFPAPAASTPSRGAHLPQRPLSRVRSGNPSVLIVAERPSQGCPFLSKVVPCQVPGTAGYLTVPLLVQAATVRSEAVITTHDLHTRQHMSHHAPSFERGIVQCWSQHNQAANHLRCSGHRWVRGTTLGRLDRGTAMKAITDDSQCVCSCCALGDASRCCVHGP